MSKYPDFAAKGATLGEARVRVPWPAFFALVVLAVSVLGGWCQAGRFVSVTLLHTCDLHGHIRPTHDYEGNPDLGGLARCATAIRDVRNKKDNVVLVDVGDTVQGTPASLLSEGQMMMRCLSHLDYDAWVPGNHEFDWGADKLAACVDAADFPVLNADLRIPEKTNKPVHQTLAKTRAYVMREFDGVELALIGLNTPGMPAWHTPSRLRGLRFADSVASVQRAVADALDAGADILVLAVHQGFRAWGDDYANQINAIAEQIPELHVILGAHNHQMQEGIVLDDALYAQAGYHGITLGRVDIQYDKARSRVSRRSSELLRMDSSVEQDSEILRLCRDDLKRADDMLAETLGTAEARFSVDGAPRRETAMHNLFFDSIRSALAERDIQVDAVLHGVLNQESPLVAGPVTQQKLWRIVPYENTIVVLTLDARHLRALLDRNAENVRSYKFLGVGGLKVRFDPKAEEGKRIRSLARPDGAAVRDDERLTIAMNSYDFAGWRHKTDVMKRALEDPATSVAETELDTRSAVARFIRARESVAPHTESWWTEGENNETDK